MFKPELSTDRHSDICELTMLSWTRIICLPFAEESGRSRLGCLKQFRWVGQIWRIGQQTCIVQMSLR